MTTGPSLDKLSACLCDASGSEALDARFRALFSLKGLAAADGARTQAVIDVIAAAFEGNDSALLKHEMAYVLGQIKDVGAMPCLERVLADAKEHAMVRHEVSILALLLHEETLTSRVQGGRGHGRHWVDCGTAYAQVLPVRRRRERA